MRIFIIAPLQHQNVAKYMCLTHVWRWCYTTRFATMIFSATRRCNIVSKNGYNMVPTNRRRESSRVTSSLGRCLVYIDQTFDKECHIYNFFKRIAFIIGSILSYLMRHLAWTTRTLPYFTFRRSFLTLLSMCRLFERLQAVVSLEVRDNLLSLSIYRKAEKSAIFLHDTQNDVYRRTTAAYARRILGHPWPYLDIVTMCDVNTNSLRGIVK